jgi:hypothetical protein
MKGNQNLRKKPTNTSARTLSAAREQLDTASVGCVVLNSGVGSFHSKQALVLLAVSHSNIGGRWLLFPAIDRNERLSKTDKIRRAA